MKIGKLKDGIKIGDEVMIIKCDREQCTCNSRIVSKQGEIGIVSDRNIDESSNDNEYLYEINLYEQPFEISRYRRHLRVME